MKHCLFLASLCLFLGCKKKGSSVPSKDYRFVNYTGQRIIIDFYKSRGDYNTNKKLLKQAILDDSVDVNLDTEKTFYIDWYSEDYRSTNWHNAKSSGEAFPNMKFDTDPAFFKIAVETPEIGEVASIRKLLISGNEISQNWKAVNFYPAAGAPDVVWDQQPAYMKVIELTMKKDFTVTLHYQDEHGTDKETKVTMKVNADKFTSVFSTNSHLKGELAVTEPFSYDQLQFKVSDSGRAGMYIMEKAD